MDSIVQQQLNGKSIALFSFIEGFLLILMDSTVQQQLNGKSIVLFLFIEGFLLVLMDSIIGVASLVVAIVWHAGYRLDESPFWSY